MAKGEAPDFIVKLPVNGVWHKIGAAWRNDSDSINVVIDIGAPLIFAPKTKLVLVPPKSDADEAA